MSERLHHMLDTALQAPGLLEWRMKRFDAAFRGGHCGGMCRGVFATYAEAAAAAPKTLPLGYDNSDAAAMYRDRLSRVYPADYPLMLWLARAFEAGATRVFDLGGHVGVSYYAYQRYLRYPHGLSWQVHDVPAVMASGRELAAERDDLRALGFADAFDAAADADVLFTSGCVQYLEDTLAERLARLRRRPEWVLVNLLPLHQRFEYWTVQSIGRAFCPYRIQRHETFFDDLEQLGYRRLDVWENPEKRCDVAFSPEHSLDGYFGAALRLDAH